MSAYDFGFRRLARRSDDRYRCGWLNRLQDSLGRDLLTHVVDFEPISLVERILILINARRNESYRQILVTAEPVRRRRLWADGQPVWR
jgi:hypothetical protein